LERKQDKEDVAVLMKALQQTLKFEQRVTEELHKRYEVWLNDPSKPPIPLSETQRKFVIESIPKFKGTSGQSIIKDASLRTSNLTCALTWTTRTVICMTAWARPSRQTRSTRRAI
jgi:hypothetical protein